MEETQPLDKSLGRKIVEGILILFIALVGIAIMFPITNRSRENARRSSCQSNLKQIMLGIKQYTRDYDESFPLLAIPTASFGWAGAVQPYLKDTRIFQCPSEKTAAQTAPQELGHSDYWFNAKLGGLKEKEIENQAQTVALGEGNSSDARSHLWKIPSSWPKDPQSPLYHHLDGANFAFADGHVKWFKAGPWKNGLDSGNLNSATLRLKPIGTEVSR